MTTTWNKITKATGTAWTKVPKPSDESVITAGSPIGLLLALTYASSSTVVSGWTKINKATGTNWTKVPKAT